MCVTTPLTAIQLTLDGQTCDCIRCVPSEICVSCETETRTSDTVTCGCDSCDTPDSILCPACVTACNICNDDTCDECLENCTECRESTCRDCFGECSDCGNSDICRQCVYHCNNCEDQLCGNCGIWCQQSEELYCSGCASGCRDCSNYFSNDHINSDGRCASCQETYDLENYDDDYEESDDLYSFSDNPRLLDYSCSPNWQFIRQPWENTTYLGVELEISFPEEDLDDFTSVSVKHLRNRHIWKTDGSISNNGQESGGELVVTPHTLQAFHQVNLKAMLDGFKKAGGKSYDAGTCGLHVHVNWKALGNDVSGNLKKLQAFFMLNREFIRRFSARTKDALDRWASIPTDVKTWGNVRYQALNSTGRETLEFRCFCGTLNYRRFKSTLQFVDAMIQFVRCHSLVACSSEQSLDHFKNFINTRGEYKILADYLRGKKL